MNSSENFGDQIRQTLSGLPLRYDESITEVNDNIRLIQKKNGLTFGTDALLLAAFIRRRVNGSAVEFGAGSGIISLLCAARKKFRTFHAVEIQSDYCEMMERNIRLNGFEETITPVCGDICSVKLEREFDAVFTNPPYMKVSSGKRNDDDGKFAARHEVNGGIDVFCKAASRMLKYGGSFYAVYRPDRLIDLLCAMREYSIEPKRITAVYCDTAHKPSLVLTEGRRGGRPELLMTKPLIMYDGEAMTDDMRYIYENGDFDERYEK